MSALGLRMRLRRHRRQALVVVLLLTVAGLVVAHHATATGSHAVHGGAPMAMHGDHVPAGVADAAADVMSVCLAVLPLLLALLTAVATIVVGLRVPGRHGRRGPPLPWLGLRDRRVRAGPSFLCVMRC